MNERSDRPRPRRGMIGVGVTSFVLIFVLLALMTFAVLSLTSAQADLRLSEKSAERTTAWYEAENAANDILTDLLRAAREGPEALAETAADRGVALGADGAAVYEVPLDQDQVLAVEAVLAADGTDWEIRRWQAVSEYDWTGEEQPLDLLGPGGLPVSVGGDKEE